MIMNLFLLNFLHLACNRSNEVPETRGKNVHQQGFCLKG